MSDVKFLCPRCGSKLAIDDRAAGYSVHCPECTNPVQIPHPASAARTLSITSDLISFLCPACESKLAIDARAAGFFAKCPQCGDRLQIPRAATTTALGEAHGPPPTRPRPARSGSPMRPVLTKEEIDFLTGRTLPERGAPAKPDTNDSPPAAEGA